MLVYQRVPSGKLTWLAGKSSINVQIIELLLVDFSAATAPPLTKVHRDDHQVM